MGAAGMVGGLLLGAAIGVISGLWGLAGAGC